MKSITITTNPPSHNMKHSSFIATLLLLLVSLTASSQRVFDVEVWQSKAPEKNGLSDTASMRVFLPEERLATGRAVLICPGGGYHGLSGYTHEGTDWAPFFNDLGIAAIVLRYRMPNGPSAGACERRLTSNAHHQGQRRGVACQSKGRGCDGLVGRRASRIRACHTVG